MRNSVRSVAARLALAAVALAALGTVAHAEMAIAVYGGLQGAGDSTVSRSAGPDFTAGWEGKSFETPPYIGARAIWWPELESIPELGFSLDYTHEKVYADDETLAATGWSHFEFTDGLNIITLNALYRMPIANSNFTPYVGLGAGVNIPHVEVTRASGYTSEYQLGGAALQAQAGVDYRFNDQWSVFAEYKGNYSFITADIDSGETLKTNIFTNAVNLGVAFHF
nr:outer membrane beta-barrel protein [uncultured Gellertiella sp.]